MHARQRSSDNARTSWESSSTTLRTTRTASWTPRRTLMWRNTDVAAFVEWMREHNDGKAAELKPPDKVLEVGTGSGYAAAVAARLAKTVHTIERHEDLAGIAAGRLAALGYDNCIVHTGDGTRGLPEAAP